MRRTVFSKPCGASAGCHGGAGFRAPRASRGSQGLRAAAFSSPPRRRSEDAPTESLRAEALDLEPSVSVERRSAKNSEFLLMRGANVHSASSRASASSRDVRAGGLTTRSPVTAENVNAGPAVSWLRRSARAAREGENTRSERASSPASRETLLERRFEVGLDEVGLDTRLGWNVHSAASSASRAARAASTAASAAARFDKSRSATSEERFFLSFASLDAGVPRA